jgi:membrane protease YdiL (CAAX protease family)
MNSTLTLTTIHMKSGRKLLIALGASIGLALFTGVTTGLIVPRVAPALSDVNWLATIIATEAYLSFIAGHLIAFNGFSGLRQQLDLNRTSWRDIGLAFLLWIAMWFVILLAIITLSPIWGFMDEMGNMILKIGSLYGRLENATPALLIVALFQPIILAPLAEELLFRGSLFGWLRNRFNVTVAILISSALFALYHPSIYLWPLAFIFGLISAWFRERSGSLTPFLVVHIANSIAMITAAYIVTGWHVPD